jgi:catechol 2,3-dioxygenase-like lactoylglutathione lyase family enzyme
MHTAGLNHIIITISNVPRSRAFYGDVLGFELKDVADGFSFKAGEVTLFFFPSNHPLENDRFNEFRIGLDHLSFNAPDEAALHALAETLIAAGVETKGVETYFTGNKYVAFRDPDNIQLEYWLPKQDQGSP